MTQADGYALPKEDILGFAHQGYAGPLQLCPEDEMRAFADRLEPILDGRVVGRVDIPKEDRASVHKYFWKHWHLYSRTVHDMVTRPQILDRVASLLGDDLLLWKSVFFKKNPQSSRSLLPYHQGGLLPVRALTLSRRLLPHRHRPAE